MTLKVITALIALFASIWVFNHINPWLAIGMIIAILYISVKHIIKQLDKNEKK